jgi:hypothetical protein
MLDWYPLNCLLNVQKKGCIKIIDMKQLKRLAKHGGRDDSARATSRPDALSHTQVSIHIPFLH